MAGRTTMPEHVTIRCLNCEDNRRLVKMAENAVNLEMVESLKRANEIHRLFNELDKANAKVRALEMEVKHVSGIRYSQADAIHMLQVELRLLRSGYPTRQTSYRGDFHTLRFHFERSSLKDYEVFARDTDNDHSLTVGDSEEAFQVNEIFERAPMRVAPGLTEVVRLKKRKAPGAGQRSEG